MSSRERIRSRSASNRSNRDTMRARLRGMGRLPIKSEQTLRSVLQNNQCIVTIRRQPKRNDLTESKAKLTIHRRVSRPPLGALRDPSRHGFLPYSRLVLSSLLPHQTAETYELVKQPWVVKVSIERADSRGRVVGTMKMAERGSFREWF